MIESSVIFSLTGLRQEKHIELEKCKNIKTFVVYVGLN
jgi:hypothetical protein